MILPDRKRHSNRSAFVSDLHAPRHDPGAFSGLLEALADWKPETLFLLGDIWDCAELSRHPKSSHLDASNLQASIDSGCEAVKEIVQACGKNVWVILMFGNHECWAQKWLANQAPAVAGLRCLQMAELFRLDEIGVNEVYPYGHVMQWNGLSITHGRKAKGKAGQTGHQMMVDHFSSGVSGHVHRLCRVDTAKTSGRYFWVENGCLCRMDPEFVEDGIPDWQHGFSVGFQADGRYEVIPIPLQGSTNFNKVHEVKNVRVR